MSCSAEVSDCEGFVARVKLGADFSVILSDDDDDGVDGDDVEGKRPGFEDQAARDAARRGEESGDGFVARVKFGRTFSRNPVGCRLT